MPLVRLGTTSWSLQPKDPQDLVRRVELAGLTGTQLALSPVVTQRDVWADTIPILLDAGISVLGGMMQPVGEDYTSIESIARTGGVRPDHTWSANEAMARAMAVLAHRAHIDIITMHAGFIPSDVNDPERSVMLNRIKLLVKIFADQGVRLALETGQESASALSQVLEEIDHPMLGINFDPANMLLYGSGDPMEAMALLAPSILSVHMKDAVASGQSGVWGKEMPLGEGDVDWNAFHALAASLPQEMDAVIEREGGDQRIEDIVGAAHLVKGHIACMG